MQQGCWDELEAKIGQSRAGAWEDHPALALPIALYTEGPGVIAQCTESSEPEDSLKSHLKPPPQCSFQQGLQGSVKFLCEPKHRKQQTAKWVKQKWFPSSSPLLPSSGEQDCCALQCPQRAPSLGKRQSGMWVGTPTTAPNHRGLWHQVTFPPAALWQWQW